MIVHVVTSCSAKGFEQYGARFIETFVQYWPSDVVLNIVSEDDLPVKEFQRNHPERGIVFWPLSRSQNYNEFAAKYAGARWTQGQGGAPRPHGIAPLWKDGKNYNFRFDAFKFSKKVFAIELVSSLVSADPLFWVDADTLTHAPVPMTLFNKVLPPSFALSCLFRPKYHSECGFVGYNLAHSAAKPFIGSFSALYHTGAVFELPEWHDSWVFDWLRNKLQTRTYNIPHKSKGHPFINSELGLYMDHLKGRRKDKGASAKVEQICHPNTAYWKGLQKMKWSIPAADTYFGPILERTPEGFEIPHLQEALLYCAKYGVGFKTALDIGAHIGTWTVNLAKVYSQVVAFEPAYDTFTSLKENTKHLPNVAVYNIALGATNGKCQSVDDPTRVGNTGSRMVKPGEGVVRLLPLDFFHMLEVDFIKIDVEGFEIEVLKGAHDTINCNRPVIVMECKEFSPPRNGGVQASVLFLTNMGYHRVGGIRNDAVFVPNELVNLHRV